ncbi:MAG: hypothetical protein RIT45_1691 [Pseudomonadota bacterium]
MHSLPIRPALTRLVPLLLALFAAPAWADPATILFDGVLRASGGGPASDGDYALTFSLYAKPGDASPTWNEKAAAVKVAGGAFLHALGSVTALPDAALAGSVEIGVKVGDEPELPRMPLHAVAFARRAAVASGVACSGCVPVGALLFDGDLDLGGFALKAKNGVFTGAVTAQSVSAQSFAGDGSKLVGVPVPKGACKTGEVMIGIGADLSVQCAKAATGGDLAAVTGGLLTNVLTRTANGASLPAVIPDNTGAEAVALANLEEAGAIESLSVSVKLQNSDLSKVRVLLLPPDDKQKGITLCDPCGATDAKSLDLSWPPAKEQSGALADYIGKSGKGLWTLKVLDTGFCIPQAPGNAGICDVGASSDGALLAFTVKVQIKTTATVAVPGTLIAQGGLQLPLFPKPAPACTATTQGATYLDAAGGQLVVCDGADWRTLPFSKACGNQIVSGDEECDDGNNVDTDACTNACKKAVCGDKVVQTGVEECDDGNTVSNDGCSAQCKSEASAIGCKDGSVEVQWSAEMVGCNGNFVLSNYETACSTGWHPANANEYATYGGKTKAPNAIYWVDTAWDSAGKDTSLKNWQGYYDSSNGAGWNGLSKNNDCTWIASPTEACYLSFSNHDYGPLKGCHCRGGNPNSTGHGVVCVLDSKALPRL